MQASVTTCAVQVSAHGNLAHTGSIDAIVAGLDGYLWVGYHKGRLERYTAGGMLLWWKASTPSLMPAVRLRTFRMPDTWHGQGRHDK